MANVLENIHCSVPRTMQYSTIFSLIYKSLCVGVDWMRERERGRERGLKAKRQYDSKTLALSNETIWTMEQLSPKTIIYYHKMREREREKENYCCYCLQKESKSLPLPPSLTLSKNFTIRENHSVHVFSFESASVSYCSVYLQYTNEALQSVHVE
jgi:hypothetical protein